VTSLFFLPLGKTFPWLRKGIDSCNVAASYIWLSPGSVVSHTKLSFKAPFSVVLVDLQSVSRWSRQLACWVVVNHLGSHEIDFLSVFVELWFDLGLLHILPCLSLPYNFDLLGRGRFSEHLVLPSYLDWLLKRFVDSGPWLDNLRLVKSFPLLLYHKSHLLIGKYSCCWLLCLLE